MAQLGVKVNHFGKTDISNLYKNQRITNLFKSCFMSFNKVTNVALAANAPNCRASQLPQNSDRRQKSCSFDRLGYRAGLRFESISSY